MASLFLIGSLLAFSGAVCRKDDYEEVLYA